MADDDPQHYGALVEELREHNRAVMDALGAIQRHVHALPEVRQRIRVC